MVSKNLKNILQRYVDFYQTVDKGSTKDIVPFLSPDVYFKDPFNSVYGIENYLRILDKMFDDTDNPKFTILDYGFFDSGVAYIKWEFHFYPKGKTKLWCFEGVSEVRFNAEGQIIAHIDYWDSSEQLLEKLPFIGFLCRLIKQKLSIHKKS